MKQSTIFSILLLILTKRKVSRNYIAERFSISKRTVSRYLTVLEDAGVPIVSVSGPGGGISLADDFILSNTFFTEAESMRIKDALRSTAENYGDKVNVLLIEKLDCMQKSREQTQYIIRQDDLYIDCDFEQAQIIKPKIKTLTKAIDTNRCVEITYTDVHGYVSYRTVEPYTLVFKAGDWYLYALCMLRGDFRLFKLSRICELRLTSKSFVRTESNLLEKLDLQYYNEVYVELEFEFFSSSSVTESVVDWLGSSAITERGTKLIASAEVPLNDALYKRLLAYGSSIKVLKPAEIAAKLKEEARLMLGVYGESE